MAFSHKFAIWLWKSLVYVECAWPLWSCKTQRKRKIVGSVLSRLVWRNIFFSVVTVWVSRSDGILNPLCLLLWLWRTLLCVNISVVYILVTLTVYLSLCLNLFLCCSCGFCHCWGYQECDGVKILVTLNVNVSHYIMYPTTLLFVFSFLLCVRLFIWFCVVVKISPYCWA